MSDSPLSRFAAPIAIVGGALVVVTRLVSLTVPTEVGLLKAYVLTATHAINSVASIVAFALLALALVAAYDREARPAGTLGVVAFGAAIVGTVFMAGDWWFEAFAVPRIAEVAPQVMDTFVGGRLLMGGLLSFALFGLGWALFGIASLRARVFPAAISVAILAGGLLSGVPIGIAYLTGGVILGLAMVWLGAWMVRTTAAATATGEQVEAR
ncbi:MAG TPA: hypothetical protein VLA91_16420 [Acidimicrobiia bacterium]|nr:hypothetical protein [Acidimicrobiia bacterium]